MSGLIALRPSKSTLIRLYQGYSSSSCSSCHDSPASCCSSCLSASPSPVSGTVLVSSVPTGTDVSSGVTGVGVISGVRIGFGVCVTSGVFFIPGSSFTTGFTLVYREATSSFVFLSMFSLCFSRIMFVTDIPATSTQSKKAPTANLKGYLLIGSATKDAHFFIPSAMRDAILFI